jgi:hypothetical protein
MRTNRIIRVNREDSACSEPSRTGISHQSQARFLTCARTDNIIPASAGRFDRLNPKNKKRVESPLYFACAVIAPILMRHAIVVSIALLTTGLAFAEEFTDYSLYGMAVESTFGDANEVTVTTTGATYVLNRNGMDMYRRIDPKTNVIDSKNSGKGRKVAELKFVPDIGVLSVISWDKGKAEISSDKAAFSFYSDSFFVMEANDNIDCNYTNLIPAKWNAPLEPNDRKLDRIWIDGSGGSLHAKLLGEPALEVNEVNQTRFAMSAGDEMGFMAFPPKTFDFNGLYGQNAKPFVHFISTTTELNEYKDIPGYLDYAIAKGYGVFVIWGTFYTNGAYPVMLDSGIMGYKFDSATEANVIEFITAAHGKGVKVLPYLFKPRNVCWDINGVHQPYLTTLAWMKSFQTQYGFDGWYLDESDTGTLWEDYDFIRRLRTDVGENGIIYHHDSPDAWDQYDNFRGLRAININAYVNYTYTGENIARFVDPQGFHPIATEDQPNDLYFRYYVSGYGTSQAYGVYTFEEHGGRPMMLSEISRTMAENLNALSLDRDCTAPYYEKRRDEYLNDANVPFVPDVNWPVNSSSGWFRYAGDVSVTAEGSNIIIGWTTPIASDSRVYYTSEVWNEMIVWWNPTSYDTPVNTPVGSSNKVTNHSVTLSGLAAGAYNFRIRSSNLELNEQEIIWSYVGTFVVGPQSNEILRYYHRRLRYDHRHDVAD